MCTVTWLPTRDGYELRMNRDELRTRAIALPPAVYERNGVRYIAPRDVDGGGTWIVANETGVVICLLNGPLSPDGRTGTRSRGLLVEDLSDARSVAEVRTRLAGSALADYSAFTLLALEPGLPACVSRWSGSTLVVDPAASPSSLLTSSSFDPDAVVASRTAVHREFLRTSRGRDGETLDRFHRDHSPERSHRSVCMHRDDASTVSFTRIAVCRDAVLVHYEDGPACSGLAFDPVAILRRSAASRRPLAGVR